MLDMINAMKESEAVEIGLRNGHVLYGKFKEVLGTHFVLRDPEGSLIFIPVDEGNIAYIKLVAADPEISAAMDKAYGKQVQPPIFPEEEEPPSRRVDVPPIILSGVPGGRLTDIEQVKERWRHNTSFAVSQTRPAFRPRIQIDGENKEDK